ncbi:MAG: WbqC family protein [Marinilabiliaceae bacterium]|nr:WbqC family protein [Marinilabiliaceae bacterium]
MLETPIFSTAFFPPVQYFSHLYAAKNVLMEANENYQKKSYRNRCMICGANGTITLSVPVEKSINLKQPVKDVRVVYHSNWNENHWKTIESAYSSSPYFLFYENDIRPIFTKKWNFLLDLNIASIHSITDCLEIECEINLTQNYNPVGYYEKDFRELINHKKDIKKDKEFTPMEYHQVFAQKHGFIPNLSILDLLFNKGPETELILSRV